MHDDLYQYLKKDPGFIAIFGGRIYHEFLPQSEQTYPALVFQLASSIEIATDMDDDDSERMDEDRWQFDVYARDSRTVIDASNGFDSIFRKFRGMMGATAVQLIERANKSHLGEVIGDKQNRRVSLDYSITFTAE